MYGVLYRLNFDVKNTIYIYYILRYIMLFEGVWFTKLFPHQSHKDIILHDLPLPMLVPE